MRWNQSIVVLILVSFNLVAYANKTLVFCSEASPAGFDAGQYTAGTDMEVSADNVFNRLIQFKRGSTVLEPALATHWIVSQDGLTYTFHLRRGVQFHTTDYFKPTRALNADDVVFTFERMRNPRHLFRLMYPTEFPLFSDMGLDKHIIGVFKVDPYTVRFVLRRPDAVFVHNLSLCFASIHSFEYAQQLYKTRQAAQINLKPIGTGPFIFKRYIKDQQIRYVGNKQYWDQRPDGQVKLDALIFSITPESKIRAQKIKSGECHVTVNPKPEELLTLKQHPHINLMSQTGFNISYLAYNTQKPPLNQRLVRQALDMAIDKKAIIRVAHRGFAIPAVNLMPPAQWSYDTSLKNTPYDPKRAKLLLKKAGYPNGFTVELWVQLSKHPANQPTAELIQADWRKIGVKTKVVSYEWGEFLSRRARGEHQVTIAGWIGDNGDPDNWLGTLLSCGSSGDNNYSRWCHLSFNHLLLQARRITNMQERTRLYQSAQKIVKQEVPTTPLVHTLSSTVINRSVQNYKKSVFGSVEFRGVDLVE